MRLGESRRVFIQGRSVGRGAAYLGRTAPENVYEARLNPPPLTSRFPPSCPSSPPHNASSLRTSNTCPTCRGTCARHLLCVRLREGRRLARLEAVDEARVGRDKRFVHPAHLLRGGYSSSTSRESSRGVEQALDDGLRPDIANLNWLQADGIADLVGHKGLCKRERERGGQCCYYFLFCSARMQRGGSRPLLRWEAAFDGPQASRTAAAGPLLSSIDEHGFAV